MTAESLFVRVDHVQLAMPVGQESAARDFYSRILQMEEVPKPSNLAKRGGAWFRSGDVVLHLGVEEDFRPAKKAHPALRCSNYTQVLERLRACGVEIIEDKDVFQGKARCYIFDVFGNRIELLEC